MSIDLNALLMKSPVQKVEKIETPTEKPAISTNVPAPTASSVTPSAPTQYEIISSRISELQSQILANHPQMPLLLREIHSTLKNDPAVVTLLKEEEIAIIVSGLEKQTRTYIAESMVNTKSTAKKAALKNVTSADLGF